MKCFLCGEEIAKGEMVIIPLDIPYANIPVHRTGCIDYITSYGTEQFMRDNIERVYELSNFKSTKRK